MCHSPLLDNPMQETMDCSMKMDEYSSLYGRILTHGMLIYMLTRYYECECELYLRQGGPISYGAVILRGPVYTLNHYRNKMNNNEHL